MTNLDSLRDRRPDMFPRPKPPHVSTGVGRNRMWLARYAYFAACWRTLIAHVGAAA